MNRFFGNASIDFNSIQDDSFQDLLGIFVPFVLAEFCAAVDDVANFGVFDFLERLRPNALQMHIKVNSIIFNPRRHMKWPNGNHPINKLENWHQLASIGITPIEKFS